jgi:hypothetical protein
MLHGVKTYDRSGESHRSRLARQARRGVDVGHTSTSPCARCEDPGYLGSRDVHVEPMQGMAGQHGIDGRVRQRYRLGTTRQGTDRR